MTDAIVIGGGLAGCSLARHLSQRGHDVVLLEKDTYPRHKLCGEFLSPESQDAFRDLGVLDTVFERGAHEIDRARLTAPGRRETSHDLPGTALGLSRYRLDALLFEAALDAGVDGRTGTAATGVTGSLADGFSVETDHETLNARLVFGAYGKRATLDRTLDRPFIKQKTPWVAFKAHFAGSKLPGTIEIHAFDGGYVGCSHVEEDRVNVCWIGTTDALKEAGGTPDAMLDAARTSNPALDDRMSGLTRVSERFHAISQVTLARKGCFTDDVCMVGDTAQMIAPLCGDGMSMALHSAALAAPLAHDVLTGRASGEAFRRRYQDAWTDAFATRLRVGRWAHHAAFHPWAATALVGTLRALPPLARWTLRATRGM